MAINFSNRFLIYLNSRYRNCRRKTDTLVVRMNPPRSSQLLKMIEINDCRFLLLNWLKILTKTLIKFCSIYLKFWPKLVLKKAKFLEFLLVVKMLLQTALIWYLCVFASSWWIWAGVKFSLFFQQIEQFFFHLFSWNLNQKWFIAFFCFCGFFGCFPSLISSFFFWILRLWLGVIWKMLLSGLGFCFLIICSCYLFKPKLTLCVSAIRFTQELSFVVVARSFFAIIKAMFSLNFIILSCFYHARLSPDLNDFDHQKWISIKEL